jgi:predicted RNA polymerase sigma factor
MPIMLAGTERRAFLASSPSAAAASRLLRAEVAYEAIRLARTLAALQPGEPEGHGLLALCELTAARFPARTGPDGFAGPARGPGPVAMGPLGDPPWAGRAGQGIDSRPRSLRPAAAIAATQASAPSVEATDWDRIVVLYEALSRAC